MKIGITAAVGCTGATDIVHFILSKESTGQNSGNTLLGHHRPSPLTHFGSNKRVNESQLEHIFDC